MIVNPLLIVAYIYVELQSIQLFHDFFFQPMAFCKLVGKGLLIVSHTLVKFLLGNIYIINLDVEILSG